MPTRQNIAAIMARRFKQRSETMGHKGKKRDDAALEFFIGAAIALSVSGQNDLAEALTVAVSFDISFHGYTAIERLAAIQTDAA